MSIGLLITQPLLDFIGMHSLFTSVDVLLMVNCLFLRLNFRECYSPKCDASFKTIGMLAF